MIRSACWLILQEESSTSTGTDFAQKQRRSIENATGNGRIVSLKFKKSCLKCKLFRFKFLDCLNNSLINWGCL
jgi:hypothetical protein